MSGCHRHGEDIALLAAGVLGPDERAALERHLASCPGCREFHAELARIVQAHSSASADLPVPPGAEEFHRRLQARILAPRPPASTPTWLDSVVTLVCAGRWKLALAGTTSALLLLLWLAPGMKRTPPPSTPAVAQPRVVPTRPPSPTLLAYGLAANESYEALNERLAQDAARAPGPGLVIRASTRSLAGLTD